MGLSSKLLPALFAGALLSAQTITTVVGNGSAAFSGDGGPAAQATINTAVYVATDSFGNLYVADQNNNRVRKVDSKGIITTIAGNGAPGFTGDGGPATQASLNSPAGLCLDAANNLYIADVGNYRIRKVDSSGNITTVAGNGIESYSGDGGPATQASMYIPIRCVIDAAGNLYVADQSGQRIRMINTAGIISTFAGTGANAGPHSLGSYSGDGGQATAANLNNPTAITVDPVGNIIFSDQYNQRIRKVDKNGIITTIAGNGNAAYSGDGGPATSASLNYPCGVVADQNGDIYVVDDVNNRVRKISNGTITTVAGNGVAGYGGDGGPATAAELNIPTGIAVDAQGNIYIADVTNQRVRKVAGAAAVVAPQLTAASVTNGASFQSGISPGALITIFGVNLSNNVHGVAAFNSVPLPTTLAGTSVLIGGTAIPLFYVINAAGTEQISAQAPFEIAGQQTVSIVVNNGRGQSAPVQVSVAAAQPGVFLVNATDGAFLHGLDESLVTAAKPAAGNEVVVLYCTGLGAVSPAATTGALASGTTLNYTTIVPTVTVAGAPAPVAFNGLAPGLVGLYQINFTVPASTPSGNAAVVVTSNGVASNSANLHVK
jgi:uncharacterized protein (TIGR03437 family)